MKKKLRIALHAFDIGPSQDYAFIIKEALNRGHRIVAVLNDGLGLNEVVNLKTDVLITNISSFDGCWEELQLGGRARIMDIPWLVIADTHETCIRKNAKGRIEEATIAVVASPAEIEPALDFGYEEAVYLGGPPAWFDYYFAQKKSHIVLPSAKKNILVGGIKDAAITDDLLMNLATALQKTKIDCQVIFKSHPNESETSKDNKRRHSILDWLPIHEVYHHLDDLLLNVDLGIFTSGATATIKMPCARRPVIYFENQAVRDRIAKGNDTGDWFPATSGACALAMPNNFPEILKEMCTDAGIKKLVARQETVYPKPDPNGPRPEGQILDYIENLFQ